MVVSDWATKGEESFHSIPKPSVSMTSALIWQVSSGSSESGNATSINSFLLQRPIQEGSTKSSTSAGPDLNHGYSIPFIKSSEQHESNKEKGSYTEYDRSMILQDDMTIAKEEICRPVIFVLKFRWVQVAMYHVIMDMVLVVAWFFYKESSWIKTIVFANIMFWIGSFGTCAYIVFQLFMLSEEEASKDPIYFVLARRQKGNNVMGHTNRHFVTIAKVIVAAIGCYTLGVIIYAIVIDGSPLDAQELTPCMITSLVDTHVHFVVFSVWIAYKESSWTSAVVWIILHLCFARYAFTW
nr:reverse transcriptase, RNA-dependent DNA polymerase [Tanacetum cinerariifolium]